MNKNNKAVDIVINIFFVLLCAACVFPILMTLCISFTDESALYEYGYRLIPSKLSLDAYKYVFGSTGVIMRAYGVTIFVTVTGTILGVLITAMYSYVISRPDFKYRNAFSFFSYFTMLFGGGIAATYLIKANVLHMSNTLAVLIIPGAISAWNVMVLKSFFETSVPTSIIESGKLDGAGELLVFFRLVIPIAIPGIMTIALFIALGKWNDWAAPMLYITDRKKYTLAFLMQNMLTNIQEVQEAARQTGASLDMEEMPQEGARMALCLVAAGPVLVAYPFFQKYFIQGMTIGAVKG